MRNLLSKEDIETIKSMGKYWEEVKHRGNAGEILRQEMNQLYQMFGTKLLWIVLDYAENLPLKEKE